MIDSGTLSGIFTAILLVLFVGMWVWAFSSRRRARFDEAARMPLEDDAVRKPLEGHPEQRP
jgi:cytochrome c oxidase cbb3-type subunit 4